MLSLADIVTLGNSSCGLLSILNSILYSNSKDEYYSQISIVLMFFSLFFDIFDGKIARLFSRSVIGQDLDSLADLIAFGVAPAVWGFAHGLDSLLDMIFLVFFVNCGVLRLARYNSTLNETCVDGKVLFFEGTPIPSTVLITFCMQYFPILFKDLGLSFHLASLVYALSGVLQISKSLKIAKL